MGEVVPKKSGITMIKNDANELMPMQMQIEWPVCIDYRKLNDAIRKDHFPISFVIRCLRDRQDTSSIIS